MNEILIGLKIGCAEARRGYLAPLRWSPWRSAIAAGRAPGAGWFSPYGASANELERLTQARSELDAQRPNSH